MSLHCPLHAPCAAAFVCPVCVYSVSPCVRVGRLVSHPFFGPLWRGRACCVSHVLRVLSCLFSLQLLFALVVLLNTSLVLFCFYSLETLLSTEYRYVCARVHVTGERCAVTGVNQNVCVVCLCVCARAGPRLCSFNLS